MEVEKLTVKQPFHLQSLVGKGSYVPGIKQSWKAVASFNSRAFFVQVREIPMATNYLH